MKRSRSSLLALLSIGALSLGGQAPDRSGSASSPEFLAAPTPWADSVFQSLDLDQRIAQLFMVAAYSNKDAAHETDIERLVRQRNIGGLIFFQGGPARQARLTNRYQGAARTPLLIGMDLEWGLAMRLDSTFRYPKQMTLGALREDDLIVEMGRDIARQMRRLGVHVSFSPVADVNNNPANPVINDRSFGEDRENVTRKAIAYMRGLQQGGVIATAKHFPGHGDTDTDSHQALPLIAHGRDRLDSLELYPFRRMVKEGLNAMMVAHLEVPALDSTPGLPSTLSRPVVSDLLEQELGFRGLVFTDALNMRGVADADQPGEVELRALKAGNDVLLFPIDPEKAIARIRRAVDEGELPREVIDGKCLKVLRAKEWAGLDRLDSVGVKGIASDLNRATSQVLRRRLYAGALTTLRNRDGLLPLRELDSVRYASVVIGDVPGNPFQQELSHYASVKQLAIGKTPTRAEVQALEKELEGVDVLITSVHQTSYRASRDFGIPDATFELLRTLQRGRRMVHVHFANPYRLANTDAVHRLDGLVVAYEDEPDAQAMAAQALFGARATDGVLPVTASLFFSGGDGLRTAALGTFTYDLPEAVGVSASELAHIDTIVQEGLEAKAYPGCQVLVAVNGTVIWDKAYGHPTYKDDRPVRTDDLYDLASLTKVAATTFSLMRLVDEGKVDLNTDLGTYLDELNGKHELHARMKLRDILTHQAGLKAWVPFYKRLLDKGEWRPGMFTDKEDEAHTVRVAQRVYMRTEYRDSLYVWLLNTPVGRHGEYVYSDMGYYLLQRLIERVSGLPLNVYVERTFYGPMGLHTLTYMPYWRFPKERIMPTEYDVEFRRQQVWGDVHDPGAAMLGGVAGHAGLFGDAQDVGALMQLLLNKGTYGGRRYLSEAVVKEFTRCQYCKMEDAGSDATDAEKARRAQGRRAEQGKDENRRGLGFDKPVRDGDGGPTCDCVSYASFGHTGFTGTMMWADPEQQVVYVFLSNRVYPVAANRKLLELDIRTRIQEVIHDAVGGRVVADNAS